MASEDGVRGGAAVSFGQEFAVLPPAQGICQACLHFAGLIDIHTKYIIAAWWLEGYRPILPLFSCQPAIQH